MTSESKNLCRNCKANPPTVSAIINGKLVEDICQNCYQLMVLGLHESSASAQYDRDRDVEDHAHDVAQPYVGGKPNPDFIRLYPEQAKTMFTEEELRLYG